MIQEILDARKQDFANWLTPTVRKVLTGVEAMCLDYHKAANTPLYLNTDGQSYTDGTSIIVSLPEYFLDPKYNETFWLLVMKASTAHECQHINSSSISKATAMARKYAKYMKQTYQLHERIGKNLAFQMFNIVEDGRIENIIVSRMPGLLINFKIKNGEIRAHGTIRKKAESGDSRTEYEHFMNQILSYAKCGGNLPGIRKYHGERLEKEFLAIRPYIKQGVMAYSCGECLRNVEQLLMTAAPYLNDLLKADSDFLKQMEQQISVPDFSGNAEETEFNENGKSGQNPLWTFQQEPEEAASEGNQASAGEKKKPDGVQPDEQQSGTGKQDKDSSGEHESDDGKQGKTSSAENDPKTGNEENKQGKPASSENGPNAGKQANGDDGDSSNGESQKADKQDKDSSESHSSADSKSDNPSSKPSVKNQAENKKDLSQEIPAGTDVSGDFSNIELETVGYTEDELKQARTLIEQELQNWENGEIKADGKYSWRGQKFQTQMKNLYHNTSYQEIAVPCGTVPTPPEIMVPAKKLKQELVKILKVKYQDRRNVRHGQIDARALWKLRCREDNFFEQRNKRNKSSVAIYLLIDNSGSMNSAQKSIAARYAAAVMEDAFSEFASCKIAMFASGVNVTHWIIKEFDKKERFNASFNSLNCVSPTGGNMDGYSIRVAAEELKKRPERKKFLILLSDGLPSDYPSQSAGQEDVRQAVSEARKQQVEVIPIMFGNQSFQAASLPAFQFMYERNIITSSVQHITEDLARLFKKLVV